ncbi:MAG TPA: PspC domain-containing protein, partial [Bacteroidales bacterium]|nr:PspC domain-containing protein [Bacteroidales bacterium]
YWNMEPWIVRIIFFILAMMGGIGILIYLILYIVIPEAKTTTQKIEMKGEPVNIHNIKNAVKEEFDKVRKNMNL